VPGPGTRTIAGRRVVAAVASGAPAGVDGAGGEAGGGLGELELVAIGAPGGDDGDAAVGGAAVGGVVERRPAVGPGVAREADRGTRTVAVETDADGDGERRSRGRRCGVDVGVLGAGPGELLGGGAGLAGVAGRRGRV
jgi:hypothetical protein